jgi:hypothetical protein
MAFTVLSSLLNVDLMMVFAEYVAPLGSAILVMGIKRIVVL